MLLPCLLIVDLDSSFEGQCERVEGGLPAGDPACASVAAGVEASDGGEHAFEG